MQTYNLIVEIPRFSQAKFEIHREHLLNPIVQDKEDGQLRYLPNIFPWHGHICNYGAFPQTWENPFHEDEWTGLRGDKDPIDVCEIGSFPVPTGTVLPVRVSIAFIMEVTIQDVVSDTWHFGHDRWGRDGLEGYCHEQRGSC